MELSLIKEQRERMSMSHNCGTRHMHTKCWEWHLNRWDRTKHADIIRFERRVRRYGRGWNDPEGWWSFSFKQRLKKSWEPY